MGAMSEVATTVAESAVPSKKLRVKILAKKPLNEASEISQANLANSLKKQPLTDGKSKAFIVEKKLESNQGTKRKSEEVLDGRESKRLKMDRLATVNCQTILSKLMKNKLGGPFCIPVDPKAWVGIDDYFDIIKNPMDLGTIQKKLQKKLYTHVEEFEADVRLTFSNAMLYNPPNNWVHTSAKELDMLFTRLWKFDNMRMDEEHKYVKNPGEIKQRGLVSSNDRITYDAKSKPDNIRMDGEQKYVKNQVEIKQRDLVSSNDRITDDAKSKPDNMRMDGEHEYVKNRVEIKRRDFVSSNVKITSDVKSESDKTRLDGEGKDIKQQVDVKQKFPDSSCDKITSDGKDKCSVRHSPQFGWLHQKVVPQKEKGFDTLKKVSVGGQQIGEYGDLNVVKDDKPKEPLSSKKLDFTTFPCTTSLLGATAQGLETMDFEISPSKALRVARLRSRFADTILKAQHQTLLEPGSETNKANWQQEKLILERRQQEEKARIEAQIRAVESAARLKAESELKQQREAARKASRLALEKMKPSVDFGDNLHVLQDLEAMVGGSLVVVCHDRRSHSTMWSQIDSKNLSPLQRLGLYIKEEYRVGDDDDYDFDIEEGEVV